MGYRQYLALLDNEAAETLSKMSETEFLSKHAEVDSEGYVKRLSPYEFPTHEKVFELGKYVSQEFIRGLTGSNPVPFFQDEALNQSYEEYGIFTVGKAGLLALIENYRETVAKSYEDMLTFSEEDSFQYFTGADLAFKQKRFFESRRDDWQGKFVDYLNTDESQPHTLSRFWDYEYLVFDLIHILKTVDWDNKQLILYGY